MTTIELNSTDSNADESNSTDQPATESRNNSSDSSEETEDSIESDPPYIEDNLKRLHPSRCLTIQKYGHMSRYQPLAEADDISLDEFSTCALCQLELTEDPENYAETALDIFELYLQGNSSRPLAADALRHIDTRAEEPLQDAGYLKENTGFEVRSISHWKSVYRDNKTQETAQLIAEAAQAHFIFYLFYNGFPYDEHSITEIIEMASSGDIGLSCAKDVAKTVSWITDFDVTDITDELNDITNEYPFDGLHEDGSSTTESDQNEKSVPDEDSKPNTKSKSDSNMNHTETETKTANHSQSALSNWN